MRTVVYSMLSALVAVTAYIYYDKVYLARNESVDEPSGSNQGETVSVEEPSAEPPVDVIEQTMIINRDGTSIVVDTGNEPQARAAPAAESGSTLSLQYSKESEEAVRALQTGDYEKAVSIFREVSKTDRRAFLGMGVAYFKMQNYREARSFLETSLTVEDSFAARKLLAYVYYYDDMIENSLESINAALAMKNDDELVALKAKLESEAKTQQGFQSDNAMHFKVFYDGYAHGGLSYKVIDILESAYSDIGSEIYHFPDERITVILYAEKGFFDVTRVPGWAGGLYDGKIRLPIKDINVPEQALKNIIYHEYTHALVTDLAPNAPTWIQEGLAEYFSSKGRIIGQVVPLNKLEGPFVGMNQAAAETAYSESYSAVKYLVDKHGMVSFKYLLQCLGEGKSLNQAFDTAFYISYDEFVSTWGKQ